MTWSRMILTGVLGFLTALHAVQGERFHTGDIKPTNSRNVIWKNCVNDDAPIKLKRLEISPHPLRMGEKATVYAELDISRYIGNKPEHIALDGCIKMKIGSEYKDICNLLSFTCSMSDFCRQVPPYIDKHPVCPAPPGLLLVNETTNVKPVSFEIHGSFELGVALKNQTSMLGCVVIRFCINQCSH